MSERDPLGADAWWGRIDACRKVRTQLFATWRDNVSYRTGHPFRSTPPEGTVNVPADWSRTKNKQSQLFFQLPEVMLRPRRPEWAGVTQVFAAALNFELSEHIHAEHMMNECLGDVINASGVMICMIGYEASFEDVPMSASEPEFAEGSAGGVEQAMPGPSLGGQVSTQGAPAPNVGFAEGDGSVPVVQGEIEPEGGFPPAAQEEMVPRAVYECYSAERVSPAHFIWPVEFVGSNWQKAHFLGREGYLLVADAIRRGWVPEGTEGVQITESEWLLVQDAMDTKPTDSYIKYVEIFTRAFFYDAAEKDPRKIRRIVLVETGGDAVQRKKVVDEDYACQRKDPKTGRWVGLTDYPIKVGTITHVSDLAIPPSDSEIGRPQVRELIKSRTQMVRQRDHSMPLRWYDVNQVDPVIGDRLRKGKWQDMIPMNGPGTNAIGEVARAQYPPENWNFDKVIKGDLDEAWSMGAMQQGIATPGETTATEVKEMSGANNTRLDYERQWVLRFFLEVAKGVGSLMQLFSDDEDYAYVVGDDGVAELKKWNKDLIQGEYIFEARPDSQLRLDVGTRRAEGLNLYKLLRKDPLIDPTALVRRLLEDHGLDPTKMIVKAEKPQPQGPRISASIKGEDMLNPMAVALINKSATPVTAQDIAAAKELIAAASVTPQELGMAPVIPGQQPGGAQTVEHPGPADVVQPLNRRYNEQGSTGVEGSRDSAMPTVK